ncbi:MAG TPA: hypothetical protein VL099_00945 [Candidatus Binatia bacterium]|nr:hypothetical protein [Candidatus Binatia bacterium]
MFRLTQTVEGSSSVFIIEGRLAGPAIEAIGELIRKLEAEAGMVDPVIVDLTEVTAIDAPGKALLKELHHRGASFRAKGCLNRAIVEGITCCGADSVGKQVETSAQPENWNQGGAK